MPYKDKEKKKKWDRENSKRRYRENPEDSQQYCLKNKKRIKDWQRKYYQEVRKERDQKRQKVLKLEVFIHYSGNPPKCVCCGESHFEFLTIDHIGGGGRQHRRKIKKWGSNIYRWLKQNNYPKDIRILCMNCNFSLGKFGYCPHGEVK